MKITVTQDDIDKGKSCDPFNCPIALAAKRAFPGREVRADLDYLNTQDAVTLSHYPLPREAKEFMDGYDCGDSVRPIEFEIPTT